MTIKRTREVNPGGYKSQQNKRLEEVFALMAQGYSNIGIAKIMGLSSRTVDNYAVEINSALGLQDDPDRNRRVMVALLHQQGASVNGAPPGPADGPAPQRPG